MNESRGETTTTEPLDGDHSQQQEVSCLTSGIVTVEMVLTIAHWSSFANCPY